MHSPTLVTFALYCFTATAAAQTSFSLDPRATFLRVSNDQAVAPLVVPLASLGAAPGTWLQIDCVGAYRYINGGQDTYYSMIGVFSADATVLPDNLQVRVPGAIAAGPVSPSGSTYYNNLPMDIPEDFLIARNTWGRTVEVKVPAGAQYLMLGTHDSWYADNVDPNLDFAAVLTVVPTPPMAGTGEQLYLLSGVNAAATPTPLVKTAAGGSNVGIEVRQNVGVIDGALFLVAADIVPTNTPPAAALPGFWLGAGAAIVVSGVIPTDQSGWVAGFNLTVPPGFAGLSLRAQAGALTTRARNTIYVTTHGHRIDFQ